MNKVTGMALAGCLFLSTLSPGNLKAADLRWSISFGTQSHQTCAPVKVVRPAQRWARAHRQVRRERVVQRQYACAVPVARHCWR